MRTLVHLSDLHFGRDRPELLRPLLEAVNAAKPDLVAISGDLTQRATDEQFRAAAAFIEALAAPVLCVPGNHDVPLHNLVLRVVMPWRRYKRWIGRDLEPHYSDEEMIVVGANTVNPLAWQQGWFRSRSLERVKRAFDSAADGKGSQTRIVVAHHPMEHAPGERKELMRGAERAVDYLSGCGADVILTGHLHTWRAEPFAEVAGREVVLQIHAGTGLSTRMRGEVNDFNLLRISGERIDVLRYAVSDEALTYEVSEQRSFLGGGGRWKLQA